MAIEVKLSTPELVTTEWEYLSRAILQRDGFRCRWCGAKGRGVVMACDHIMPRKIGGPDSPYNLQCLCRDCNYRKGSKAPCFVINPKAWKLFHELVRAEPRIDLLFLDALKVIDDRAENPRFCANEQFYLNFKPRVSDLVGWSRQRKGAAHLVSSEAAYDVVYEVIYNVMPDCRKCGCM